MDPSQIDRRAWSYAGVLQDAGLSCFEYVEQLTLLLFLKIADQLRQPPHDKPPIVCIKDKSLTDTDSQPEPGVLVAEIVDELEAALQQFSKFAARLNGG